MATQEVLKCADNCLNGYFYWLVKRPISKVKYIDKSYSVMYKLTPEKKGII